jgi:predicted kinase
MDVFPDPCVVLMVGPSGSGKSTVAGWLAARNPGLKVLSYDAAQGDGGVCTLDAVARVHAELAARCAQGLASLVDGTHRQPERRAAVSAAAAAHGLPVVAVVLQVPLASCLANQSRRPRRVPAVDVREHHAVLTAAMPDLLDEGYDVVVVLTERVIPHLVSPTRSRRARHG